MTPNAYSNMDLEYRWNIKKYRATLGFPIESGIEMGHREEILRVTKEALSSYWSWLEMLLEL